MLNRPIQEGQRSLRLRLLDAQCTECTPAWRCLNVRNDFNRLYWVEAGWCEVGTAAGRVVLRPNRLYLFAAETVADYICPEWMRLHWLHFRLEALPGLDVFTIWSPPHSVPATNTAAFAEVEGCLNRHTPRTEMQAVAAVAPLVAAFLPDTWDALLPPRLERIAPALTLVEESYGDPDLSLTDLAAACDLHRGYFCTLFAKLVGVSPGRYLQQHRLRHAKVELLHSGRPVAAIARECGFRDAQYFARVFRQHERRTPSRYRRELAALHGRRG
jgi:AraC-like DNA-binding protein